jgi:glycosyltransferase involved in cell wall biosynthesis
MAELRLAYLVSQYPATSHTFISREIAAMRALGVQLDTFSIRAPAAAELRDEVLKQEAERTFTVFRQPFSAFIAGQFAVLATRPGGYFKTLKLALGHRPPGLRGFAMTFVYFAEALVLARELRQRGITRLHNHFANSGAIVGYLASRLLELPWSFTMHGISETDYPAGLLLGRKIEAAEFVACVSWFGRAQAMRLVAPDQWDKLKVVRCGLDLSKLPPRAEDRSGVRLICVGRLSAEKGQAGLLEAFAAALGDCPGLSMLFVGDGPERTRLEARAAELGLGDRVEFAGRCGEDETLRRIAGADVLVLSSFMEGLPIVLMEAMAVGTAVIASRVAGIPELVRDGESGLLFTPSNWPELATCIRRLAGDAGLRQALASNARAVVEQEFAIERSARQLLALFTGDEA